MIEAVSGIRRGVTGRTGLLWMGREQGVGIEPESPVGSRVEKMKGTLCDDSCFFGEAVLTFSGLGCLDLCERIRPRRTNKKETPNSPLPYFFCSMSY